MLKLEDLNFKLVGLRISRLHMNRLKFKIKGELPINIEATMVYTLN